MKLQNNNWYLCSIDKDTLRNLSKRSDRIALIWFATYFLLLFALGVTVIVSWGSWLAWPVVLLYGLVWGFAASAVHEMCHKTPFRSRWLNELFLWSFGWMMQMEPISVRWTHTGHHSFTHFDEGDTELSEPNPVSWSLFLKVGSGVGGTAHYAKFLVRQAFGNMPDDALSVIPERKVATSITNARILLATYVGVVVWAVLVQSWLPILMTFGARVIGGPVTGMLHLTQHTCLQMNVRDHRLSTRSFTASRLTRFFYFNMNYHIEHHMFPMVPFYNLPKLNAVLKDQLPAPCQGLYGVYREIFAAIRRQKKDPTYYIQKTLPATSSDVPLRSGTPA